MRTAETNGTGRGFKRCHLSVQKIASFAPETLYLSGKKIVSFGRKHCIFWTNSLTDFVRSTKGFEKNADSQRTKICRIRKKCVNTQIFRMRQNRVGARKNSFASRASVGLPKPRKKKPAKQNDVLFRWRKCAAEWQGILGVFTIARQTLVSDSCLWHFLYRQ